MRLDTSSELCTRRDVQLLGRIVIATDPPGLNRGVQTRAAYCAPEGSPPSSIWYSLPVSSVPPHATPVICRVPARATRQITAGGNCGECRKVQGGDVPVSETVLIVHQPLHAS